MFINRQRKEVNVKIVYYGPPSSGKSANLEYIHSHTRPDSRSALVSLKTKEDNTLFFDYVRPELGNVEGLKPKFNLYSITGQVTYDNTRKVILQGADGLVFVADSQPERLADNLRAWHSLGKELADLGLSARTFPIVVQFNKQDIPWATDVMRLSERLNVRSYPCFAASALQGQGVFETLEAIINLLLEAVRLQIT